MDESMKSKRLKVGQTINICGNLLQAWSYDNDLSKTGKYYQFKTVAFETSEGITNIHSVKVPCGLFTLAEQHTGRVWCLMKMVTGYLLYAVEDEQGILHEDVATLEKSRWIGVGTCIVWSIFFGFFTILSVFGANDGSDIGVVGFIVCGILTGLGILGIIQNNGLPVTQVKAAVAAAPHVKKTRTWRS